MLNLRTAGLRIISQKSPNIYLIEENCFPATMFTRPESAGGCTITKTTSGHLAVFDSFSQAKTVRWIQRCGLLQSW